jgi:hypothetical protein
LAMFARGIGRPHVELNQWHDQYLRHRVFDAVCGRICRRGCRHNLVASVTRTETFRRYTSTTEGGRRRHRPRDRSLDAGCGFPKQTKRPRCNFCGFGDCPSDHQLSVHFAGLWGPMRPSIISSYRNLANSLGLLRSQCAVQTIATSEPRLTRYV